MMTAIIYESFLNRINLLCLACLLSVSLITWRIFKVVSILFFHTQEILVSFCFPLLVLSNSYIFLHISYGNLHCAFIYFTKKIILFIKKKNKKIVFDFTHFLNQPSTYVLFVVVPSSFFRFSFQCMLIEVLMIWCF